MHYYRIPKSGSTTATSILRNSSCLRNNITVHDHGHGCRTSYCNASAADGCTEQVNVAVLREPGARFMSAAGHLFGHKITGFGLENSDESNLGERFLQFYRNLGCPKLSNDSSCVVNKINDQVPEDHRVIAYPQALFVSITSKIICFREGEDLSRKLSAVFSQVAGSPDPFIESKSDVMSNKQVGFAVSYAVHQNVGKHTFGLTESQKQEVFDLLHADKVLWDHHCGLGSIFSYL